MAGYLDQIALKGFFHIGSTRIYLLFLILATIGYL